MKEPRRDLMQSCGVCVNQVLGNFKIVLIVMTCEILLQKLNVRFKNKAMEKVLDSYKITRHIRATSVKIS